MQLFTSSRHIILLTILLGMASSVCPIRPSVLLKRSILRRRLLAIPETLRPKRQLFREDIPHHRPLTGNTYYLHAGFPHPSRWHDGSQVIPPNPNPITHHHFHNKPGLHDDLHNNNNHDHHNNHVNQHQHQLINPNPPSHHFHQYQHEQHQQQQHHHHYNQNGLQEPVAISVVNNKTPHSVNIHSAIVHANGVSGGGVIDNSLGNPNAPVSPVNQANFDPLLSPHHLSSGPIEPANGHFRNAPGKRPGTPPKPHSEPEPYNDEFNTAGDYGLKDSPLGISDPVNSQYPPETVDNGFQQQQHERKPKTIIHYHPVTVGNIINFNDDNKPVTVNPNHGSYGPPEHVPGIPLSNKDVMMSLAEPFISSPFKTVNGPPEFLDFTKDNNNVQYGPPQHVPGVPIGNLNLEPMLPSFGPPIKSEAEPPYGVALPVIAHIHSGPPRHHHPPPKRHRGKGRSFHQHHLHLHHIHHAPLPVHAPVQHPSYIVHGHVPNKIVSFHNPHFRSHSHHLHHKSFWSW